MADGRYDYIETGSLISIKENVKNIVIPSEERHINMYPLNMVVMHNNTKKHFSGCWILWYLMNVSYAMIQI